KPGWVGDFFLDNLSEIETLKTSSAKAVLLSKINVDGKDIRFVLSFGMGRYMINKDAIEERFGLITALNTITTKCIRTIEKNNIAALSKLSREQMSKDSEISEFGIDIEQDLVRAVTGKAKLSGFGTIVSGADSFCLTVERDISNILEFLAKCYEQYQKKDYQEEFGWIDQIEEIKKPTLIKRLDDLLLQRLNNRELNNIWMAAPEMLDWSDVKGFKYLVRQEDFSDDISLERFLEDRKAEVWTDIAQIKNKYVRVYSASTDGELNRWSVHKCIYGEIHDENKLFVINNGKWYQINNDFVSKVNEYYESIPLSDIVLPDYNHKSEGEYNKHVKDNDDSFLCLDANNISYGGGHSKIEFCDLLSSDCQILHLKKYGGSSVLSHLFFQGIVSGELFVTDPEFRKNLNKKLIKQWKLTRPEAKPDISKYEIIYGIISSVDEDRPHIPFFSKVSLKNAKRRLEGFGYSVKLKKITAITQN
ncbi:MAG: TIGR04141 family sporadically distributed protein, partial [Bacteroidota bacterium]|nr:TIGR04141 family sporadically distributed protein [Bacteroidota bacterium]